MKENKPMHIGFRGKNRLTHPNPKLQMVANLCLEWSGTGEIRSLRSQQPPTPIRVLFGGAPMRAFNTPPSTESKW
jgi:hypothetical protein